MSSRPLWGWFKHRLEEARCNVDMTNSDDNRTIAHHSDLLNFHSGIFQRTWGGVPIIYSFGDCHQLPPVRMKPISDMSTRPKMNTSDFQGYFAFSSFLDSNEDGTSSCSVVMDEVVRQNDSHLRVCYIT